jgi:hypothetical protein
MPNTPRIINPSDRIRGKNETSMSAGIYFAREIRKIPTISTRPKKYSVSPEKINLKYKGVKKIKI